MGGGDKPRVGAVDAGDVGVDLADAGSQRRRQGDGRRVGAAAPKRGYVAALGRNPLEAGDEDDPVLFKGGADAVGADVNDPRFRVRGVGDDSGLRAGQRDRLVTHVVDRHRTERARDPLARREQHVHLAGDRADGDLMRGRNQFVGRLAAGREHGDDPVPRLARGDDSARGALDLLGAGHRGAAELHHDDV